MKGRGFTELFIGLRSERDKSVYFWSWEGYLLYNATITQNKKKRSKNLPFFFLSDRVGSPPSRLFAQEPQRVLRKRIL